MKALLLAGLLTLGGTFFMNGCSVEDAIEDALQANVIYVVNGTGGTINVAVTGEDDKYITSQNMRAEPYALTGSSTYTVSYDGDHAKNFSYGSTYLYAASDCNAQGYVSDEIDGNRVHVVNLTGETFTGTIQVIDANGHLHTTSDDAPACSATTSNQLNDIVVGNGMQVKIGNGNWETITGIPNDVVELANTVRMDVIVYSTSTGTIVPMAGYDDLL
ncbi:MAG: hypothetical protein U9N52_10905 [Campylobacterota bacterium]|nr:hypothetical protein [Campylobacterota bacterium]